MAKRRPVRVDFEGFRYEIRNGRIYGAKDAVMNEVKRGAIYNDPVEEDSHVGRYTAEAVRELAKRKKR